MGGPSMDSPNFLTHTSLLNNFFCLVAHAYKLTLNFEWKYERAPTTAIFSNMVENTEHGPMAFKFPNPKGTTNQH
jgi:hypothetical protein